MEGLDRSEPFTEDAADLENDPTCLACTWIFTFHKAYLTTLMPCMQYGNISTSLCLDSGCGKHALAQTCMISMP